MASQKEMQERAEALAHKSEQAAKRDASRKVQEEAEADSIDEKTRRLRALRIAKESTKPDQ